MKRAAIVAILSATGIALGILMGLFVCDSPRGRDALGRWTGRGQLLALVSGHGIYAADVARAADLDSYLAGGQADDQQSAGEILQRLVAEENLRRVSVDEPIGAEKIKSAFDLLYAQFDDPKRWKETLQRDNISTEDLQADVRQNLQAQEWLEQQIATAASVTEEECRRYYDPHPAEFLLPLRLRASHLFLAAPTDTPAPVMETKRAAINALSNRVARGENFSQLVAEASEDEANKTRGGDLNYFSAARMPPEFFAAIEKSSVKQITPVFQSHLGFHIAIVTDLKPPRQMSFAEALPEIRARLTNERRAAVLPALREKMSHAEYLRM